MSSSDVPWVMGPNNCDAWHGDAEAARDASHVFVRASSPYRGSSDWVALEPTEALALADALTAAAQAVIALQAARAGLTG